MKRHLSCYMTTEQNFCCSFVFLRYFIFLQTIKCINCNCDFKKNDKIKTNMINNIFKNIIEIRFFYIKNIFALVSIISVTISIRFRLIGNQKFKIRKCLHYENVQENLLDIINYLILTYTV